MHSKPHLRIIIIVFWLLGGVAAWAETPLPNILLVVADDLGIGDSQAWYAASDKTTPTLNQLAKQGVAFQRFYTDSTCSTSRAALLTGIHPARLGFHPVAMGIAPEIITLPEYLREQGYDTALIGKWHAGEYYEAAQPWAQGFDQFYGYLNQWMLQGLDDRGDFRIQPPTYYNPWLHDGSKSAPPTRLQGYLPELLTVRAESWLADQQRKEKPWFLMYATPLPHAPVVPPPAFEGAIDDKHAVYQAMISRFDQDLARLINTLELTGQRDNTLIIVMGDNGAPPDRKGSNGGFVGGKWLYSEAALRAPLLWIWPEKFPQSRVLNLSNPAFITDVYPTIEDYIASIRPADKREIPTFDGRSLFDESPAQPAYWMSRNGFSYLTGELRYTGHWMFRTWFDRHVETIKVDHADIKSVDEDNQPYKAVETDVAVWLNQVSKTHLKAISANQWVGQDFLRTPLKEWDFYIAIKPTTNAENTPQFLAGQAGSWLLTWDGRQLDLQMHGGRWQVRLRPSTSCQLIGINADLFDRFSKMSGELSPSRITVTINGIERLDGKWLIEDLRQTSLTEPLQIAKSNGVFGAFSSWVGQHSEPQLYHRASRAGEWAFYLDEKSIQQQLCGTLVD